MKKVLIFDTSVLCCWLQVPGKTSCGPDDDRWDRERIEKLIAEERQAGSTFVLPVATIIETGNHIAQAAGDRYRLAQALMDKLRAAADAQSPWAAFGHQADLWTPQRMRNLADEWPNFAVEGLGIGDVTIKAVADYYANIGFPVEIVTGDKGLLAHQPTAPLPKPRRKK